MHSRLSYGVMVAQQFLVLFVVVRIRLGQHNEGFLYKEKAFVVLCRKGKIVVVRIRLGQHNEGFLFIEEAFVVLRRKGKIVGQWKFSGDKHKSLQVDTERTFHQRYPLVML